MKSGNFKIADKKPSFLKCEKTANLAILHISYYFELNTCASSCKACLARVKKIVKSDKYGKAHRLANMFYTDTE